MWRNQIKSQIAFPASQFALNQKRLQLYVWTKQKRLVIHARVTVWKPQMCARPILSAFSASGFWRIRESKHSAFSAVVLQTYSDSEILDHFQL